jgi:hypothetical protein
VGTFASDFRVTTNGFTAQCDPDSTSNVQQQCR